MNLIVGVLGFIFFVANALLLLLVIAIIASAVLSWLFAFDVINPRNRFVGQLAYGLDRLTGPVLNPLRRVIPSLGGLDITPIIALIVIQGIRSYLLPALHVTLLRLLGGY